LTIENKNSIIFIFTLSSLSDGDTHTCRVSGSSGRQLLSTSARHLPTPSMIHPIDLFHNFTGSRSKERVHLFSYSTTYI
jgi:hypothetical protein